MTLSGPTWTTLQALQVRYGLDEAMRDRLALLLGILESTKRAPTSVTTPEHAVDVHIADALAVLELPALRSARVVTDLGSGAGLPGLVLAVVLPDTEVSLVESQAWKCEFMARAVEALGLQNTRVVCKRAEEWRAGARGSDVVVARAVAAQPVVLEYAAPLLRLGGVLVDWRGRRRAREEDAATEAARELGLRRLEVLRVEPFAGVKDHHLHLFEKLAETPDRFPRRAGIARKRPLGGSGNA